MVTDNKPDSSRVPAHSQPFVIHWFWLHTHINKTNTAQIYVSVRTDPRAGSDAGPKLNVSLPGPGIPHLSAEVQPPSTNTRTHAVITDCCGCFGPHDVSPALLRRQCFVFPGPHPDASAIYSRHSHKHTRRLYITADAGLQQAKRVLGRYETE